MSITEAELDELKMAKSLLDNPGFIAKVSHVIGAPFEKGLESLPSKVREGISRISHKSLEKVLDIALSTLDERQFHSPSNRIHQLAAGVSGGVAGFFGLPGLAIELPISSAIMFRSIADVARSQGESLSDVETKMDCISVLALGSPGNKNDDAAESAYYATRAALASSIQAAVNHITVNGMTKDGAAESHRI